MNHADAVRQWNESRGRMRPQVASFFSQDVGVEGSKNTKFVDQLLDRFFQPEFYRALGIPSGEMHWSVWRQDDHGSQYEIVRDLSLHQAQDRVKELSAGGHKQVYWMQLSG